MSAQFNRAAIMLMVAIFCTSLGCASVQLRKIAVRQADSVADIYEQQVVDNLARFVVNPYSTPSFSIATSSTNGVRDSGSLGLSEKFLTGRFWEHVGVGGSRDWDRSFALNPVTDPSRLLLMQCAYQTAVGLPKDECNKCCELLEGWTGVKGSCQDCCGITSGWLCRSTNRSDVPKCCQKHAEYCGVYVWVDPCQQKEFSKLVNTILDFAAGSSKKPQTATKEIILYLNEFGGLTPFGTHSQVVQTTSDEVIEAHDKIVAAHENLLQEMEAATKNNVDSSQTSERIQELRTQLQDLKSKRPAQDPSIQFGPPTQFNNSYNNNLLLQQQLLNIVPNSRR